MFALLLAMLAASPFAGTWEGTMNDLPGVKLTIREAAQGDVRGSIVFYFQKRGDDGKWHVVEGGEAKGEILMPKIQGNVLSFEVRHHKSHGSEEYGPNKKFQLEVIGAKQARFRESGGAPGTGLLMTRKE